MREFEFIFDRGFTRGIRSNAQEGLNLQTVYTAYNFKAGKHGLEPYIPVTLQSIWSIGTQHWPYPVIFNGQQRSYMFAKLVSDKKVRIYEITPTSINLRHIFESYNGASATCIDAADFGKYVVFTTDSYSVVHDTYANTFTADKNPNYPLMIPTDLCCNFRGQFIYARPKAFDTTLPIPATLTNKYIGYSDIGSTNLVPANPVMPYATGSAGSLFIPTKGEVLRLLPLHNHVIAYCSTDIFALKPEIEPRVTYGWKKISDVGISWKYGVDGSSNNHVAVLSTGEVCTIDSDLRVVNLDYSEQFDVPSVTLVVYDPQRNEWRISDTGAGYVLTGKGLTSCYQWITGIYKGGTYGTGINSTDLTARLTTDVLNFGMNGVKTITGIELQGQLPTTGGTISVDYKFDSKQSGFSTSSPVTINPMGWVAAPVSGTDLRINLVFNTYAGLYLRHMKVRWKMSDLRGMRGVYSPPPRGQYVD